MLILAFVIWLCFNIRLFLEQLIISMLTIKTLHFSVVLRMHQQMVKTSSKHKVKGQLSFPLSVLPFLPSLNFTASCYYYGNCHNTINSDTLLANHRWVNILWKHNYSIGITDKVRLTSQIGRANHAYIATLMCLTGNTIFIF